MPERADDKACLITASWLLKTLAPEAVRQVLPFIRAKTYKSRQVIFRKGDPGTSMMVVADGRVKIRSISLENREVVFNLVERGDVFGEIALLDGHERTADAVAMGRTVLYVLERRDFLPLLRRNPEIGTQLLTTLCTRLRRTSEQVEDLVFLAQPARLAKTLLWLAKRYGRVSENGLQIDLKLSQRELGTLVGVRRESMNRQIGLWREQGLLAQQKGVITIRDVAAFESLAEQLAD